MASRHFLLFIFICSLGAKSESLRTVTLKNNCNTTIWPGLLEELSEGKLFEPRPPDYSQEHQDFKGFELKPGESANITAAEGWQGVIWGRSGCSFNYSGNNNASCATGDCGRTIKCDTSPKLPYTSALMLLNTSSDFYMVNLFNGYNLPMSISPYGYKNSSKCQVADCLRNINEICPSERQVRSSDKVVGCLGDCEALQQIDYCCVGSINLFTNETCKASNYTTEVNQACPRATINGVNIKQTVFQCTGSSVNYTVSFC